MHIISGKKKKTMEAVSCILLLVLPLPCTGREMREGLFSKAGEEDVIFDDHLLVSLTVSSASECALRCSRTEDCALFTFSKGSPAGTCRLHSEVMTSQCSHSKASGSATYRRRQEPGPPQIPECVANTDCETDVGFECFFGQCLCIPGYYFSVGCKICVERCEETDLQQNFMKYAVSGIDGYNIASAKSRTLEECQGLCINNLECRTFEYHARRGDCTLQRVTPLDVAWNRGDDYGWDLYQRMCA